MEAHRASYNSRSTQASKQASAHAAHVRSNMANENMNIIGAGQDTARRAQKTIQEIYDLELHQEPPIAIPNKPDSGLVLIIGSSGSGKSTILKKWFGDISVSFDNNKTVIENFSSQNRGDFLLRQFGLRSIPTWVRPSNTLSTGEYHRAHLALCVDKNVLAIDEFTSVVDRNTAKSLSNSVRKHFTGGLLCLASCHSDIEEWLLPDMVYDCDLCAWRDRRYLRRPKMCITVNPCGVEEWIRFKKHHYLSGDISKSCHCYIAYFEEIPVAFIATIHGTCRDIHSYWRTSRLVVLPEFQGLGIGSKLTECIAEHYTQNGCRYFEKTSHPTIGEYHNNSDLWKPTSTNMVRRTSFLKDGKPRVRAGFGKSEKDLIRDSKRICYSHEYMKQESPSSCCAATASKCVKRWLQ